MLIKAFDAAVIKRIEEFFQATSDQDFKGFHNSLKLHSPEQKAKIHYFFARIFDEHLSQYFNDYRALAATFVTKKPDPASVVPPH